MTEYACGCLDFIGGRLQRLRQITCRPLAVVAKVDSKRGNGSVTQFGRLLFFFPHLLRFVGQKFTGKMLGFPSPYTLFYRWLSNKVNCHVLEGLSTIHVIALQCFYFSEPQDKVCRKM